MSLEIVMPGPQASLQGPPRQGLRHLGVPSGGAADGLSHALANRLAGNPPEALAIEIAHGPFEAIAYRSCQIALTGAAELGVVDGIVHAPHRAIRLEAGATLRLEAFPAGCRAYLAVSGGFSGEHWLGSGSTYLPGAAGGFEGRALKPGDRLGAAGAGIPVEGRPALTPPDLRPVMGRSWALRAIPDPDFPASTDGLYSTDLVMSPRLSRMGGALDGLEIRLNNLGRLPSRAVFPGTVQCPEDGRPFLLMAEAQTTGGYAVLAQVIRADRHIMGQIRPGDRVRFLRATPEAAAQALREKTALFQPWLGTAFELR